MSPYASYLLEMLGTLLVVCALAALVLFGARRLGVGRATGGLELLGRLPLDARRSIVLVKVELPAASVPREALEEPRSFGSVLARALTRDVPPKPEPEPAKKEQG
jgi:hypothetical protein